MSKWPDYSISDGTEEKDRFPPSLESGYFLPDERAFEQLLALGFELARILPFHDLRDVPKGTWGELFMANEAVVMAHILSLDCTRLQSEFSKYRERGVEHSVRFTYETARTVDFWLSTLSANHTRAAMELCERVESLISERPAADLQELERLVRIVRARTSVLEGLDFDGFHPVWGVKGVAGVQEAQEAAEIAATMVWPAQTFHEQVRRIFYSLVNVITHLQTLTRPYLTESLQAQTHEPANALFMVFLELFESSRSGLNAFTDKHLDFYYRSLLGAVNLQHQPDRLFFSLQPAAGRSQVRVPAGTHFLTRAGESGAEIAFASEQDALVSDAKVDMLCTLRFERDKFISPETELGYVTRIKALRRDRAPVGDPSAAVTDWPLFGTSSRLTGHESAEDARIGFAVASPVLLLGQGQRSIEIQVQLGDPGRAHGLESDPRWQGSGEAVVDRGAVVERFVQYLSADRRWLEMEPTGDGSQLAAALLAHVETELEPSLEHPSRRERSLYELFLKALLRHPAAGADAFRRLLGEIFRHHILTMGEPLETELREEIRQRARDLLDSTSQRVVEQLLGQGHEEIFQKLLKDLFDISLTVPGGWHHVDKYVMRRLVTDTKGARSGLRFLFSLGPEVDPIVDYSPEIHGGNWGGTVPLVRFELNPTANFCAYTLLNASRLEAVVIEVRVRGLRDLRLYNNVGRLDPSKPLQPFGPLPTLSSYVAFGSYEMAQKPLTSLTVNLEWADLPTCLGGFTTHYAGYERRYASEDFQVDLSVLQDGSWQPQSEQQRPTTLLFQATGPTEKLRRGRAIDIGVLDFFRPIDPRLAEENFDLQQGVRNGYFRLGLSAPEGAFGHADYPLLLSWALAENVRSKKPFKTPPNIPYTPLISQLTVDYSARTRIHVNETRSGVQSETNQRIFHLHPFGYEEVEPIKAGRAFSLLPRYDTDGNLFIGIAGGRTASTYTLLFHLTEETNQQTPFDSPHMAWYYLSAGGWRRLPATSIVLDTTNSFLCTGIVTLTLPRDVDRQSTLMPPGRAWVRVGASACLDSFPRLYSVCCNGLRACRRIDVATVAAPVAQVPQNRPWRTGVNIPGLGEITQIGSSHGGVPPEDRRRFITRISERLRHKNRAITAWDYERLILQRFPEVFKVKCFAGLSTGDFKSRPGHILIVAVPHVGSSDRSECRRPMLNVMQLKQIRGFVQQLTSAWVKIEVRNPLYERVQVRCKARFVEDANPGFYIRRLNREVSDFLCPWVPFGYPARFGWMINREEVEGYILDRDYVEFVTDFSMLHIAEDDEDSFALTDTVIRDSGAGLSQEHEGASRSFHQRGNQVRWRYPWSLAVPMENHFIEALRNTRPIAPEPAGITELDIGGTFIIGGSD